MTNPTVEKYIAFLRSKLARPVLMGAKGEAIVGNVRVPEVYDCSGLVTSGILAATGDVDMRFMWNAQKLADACESALLPLLGDLVFYGTSWKEVIHVATWLEDGSVISGSGATRQRPTLLDALKHGDSVRIEKTMRYRKDFLGVKSNKWVGNYPQKEVLHVT